MGQKVQFTLQIGLKYVVLGDFFIIFFPSSKLFYPLIYTTYKENKILWGDCGLIDFFVYPSQMFVFIILIKINLHITYHS